LGVCEWGWGSLVGEAAGFRIAIEPAFRSNVAHSVWCVCVCVCVHNLNMSTIVGYGCVRFALQGFQG